MEQHGLDALFSPRSVAVFGASDKQGAVGSVVWDNLRASAFAGKRWPIHPTRAELHGERVYPSLRELPEAPELGVVCTPPATVPGIVDDLADRGARAVIVITAGLDEAQRARLLAAHQRTGIRIQGPNCIGTIAPHANLNASFAHAGARPGDLAFVTQSGALMTAMLDWANARELGFSHFVSLGDQLEIDCADLLTFLAHDEATNAILLYLESVQDSAKFLAAAREAAARKPVIVVKAGRSEAGSRAAASHTGALAGSDLVFDAAARRVGMLRVDSVHDLFLAAETLGCLSERAPKQLTVVTNGGGAGVLAADACAHYGVTMADLAPSTRESLDALLPANWSRGNPVDILGDAPVARYVAALTALLADENAGSILFVHAPTAIVPSAQIARALLPLANGDSNQPKRLLSCWLGDSAVAEARAEFRAAGVADYDTPEEAVRALSMLQRWLAVRDVAEATPCGKGPKAPLRLPDVRRIVDRAIAEGRQWLLEDEAKSVLAAAGIPVVATRHAEPTADDAVAKAREIGFPVALKILSPDLLHKSDIGGVALDLDDEASLRKAADSMLLRIRKARPDARLTGFSVQTMVRARGAVELILGASIDPTFGPVLLFGHGGTAVELLADRALALPPLDSVQTDALVARTRVERLLTGYRNQPPADRAAVRDALLCLSRLVEVVPEIAQLDVNPLLATEHGCIALDARIQVLADRPGGARTFALRELGNACVRVHELAR